VQAVAAGAGLMWALDREGTLPDRTRRELHSVLAPYLPARYGGVMTRRPQREET
jgi:hypothetical protein